MPFSDRDLDCSEPKSGPFHDFYSRWFYFLFEAQPSVRIGIARKAFEAGMEAQRRLEADKRSV